MKFKIRFADQIVGFFSVTAIAGLIVLVFALGSGQDWFTKKLSYFTMFDSGSGISVGMNLTYKGFSIGKIKDITLDGSQVRVGYYILATYQDYILDNSLVQLITSPIGLGSEFVFHPGNGPDLVPEGTELYRVDSMEGLTIIATGQNRINNQSDSIGVLMNKASGLLDNINTLLSQVNEGISGKSKNNITEVLDNIVEITDNISALTATLTDADGIIPKVLGPRIAIQLQETLGNVSNITGNLTDVSASANSLINSTDELVNGANALINGTDTQLNDLLLELSNILLQLQDVLTGVKNNPLIRGGIPDRSQTAPSTFHVRDEEF